MKPEEKRRMIIEGAFDLFMKKGYAPVSVNDICRALNITKPTFYNYVSSKESVLKHYFSEREDQVLPEVEKLLDDGMIYQALWEGLTGFHETARYVGPDLMTEYITHLLKAHASSYRFNGALEHQLVDLLRQMQQDGLIENQSDPNSLYRTLCQLDMGVVMFWTGDTKEFDMDRRFLETLEATLCFTDLETFEKQIQNSFTR